MDYVSFRIDKKLLKVMDKDMNEFHYATKSDFLREAIREKHSKLEEERRKNAAWDKLLSLKGSLKGKIPHRTDEEIRKLKEGAGEEFFKEMDAKFGLNLTEKKPLLASKQ